MNTTQMLRAHRLAEPAPLPSPVTAEVPPEVVRLCRRCLAKRPQDRPVSGEAAQTLAEAVHLVVPLPSDEPTVARPVAGPAEQTTLSWQIETQSDIGEPVEAAASELAMTGEAEPDAEQDSGRVLRRNSAVLLAVIVLLTLAAWAGVRAPDAGSAPRPAPTAAPAAPAVQKPAVQKPAVQKPAVQKPGKAGHKRGKGHHGSG